MKLNITTLTVCGLLCVQALAAAAEEKNNSVVTPAVIPQPKSLTRLDGAFTVSPDCVIVTDSLSSDTGKFLAERLRNATGYSINIAVQKEADQKFPSGVIVLTTDKAKADLGAEGYELQVTPAAVTIRAPAQAGLFYGVQTILQLLPPEIYSSNIVKGVEWQICLLYTSDAADE